MPETRSVDSDWRSSEYCSVAVKRNGPDEVLLRDNQRPATVLRLTTAEWSAFRDRVTSGEFD
ncbi:DUF397 domain-containing protein [Actinoplanes sp. TBRC 11911]|uniref:DUF397 domain-containing protein n=1 Tax=Actinoplanes sp. TBRC 11911 TaxID=2729386 RepID=UPI00145F73D6|nr:DUF397 domain-containing protein [Actinoplanes sp. TBRC 11911]NMO51208.1 DUF397 domain-containing protein [Actinoplanes sp. TBRC 11911]